MTDQPVKVLIRTEYTFKNLEEFKLYLNHLSKNVSATVAKNLKEFNRASLKTEGPGGEAFTYYMVLKGDKIKKYQDMRKEAGLDGNSKA